MAMTLSSEMVKSSRLYKGIRRESGSDGYGNLSKAHEKVPLRTLVRLRLRRADFDGHCEIHAFMTMALNPKPANALVIAMVRLLRSVLTTFPISYIGSPVNNDQ